jgi:hypothetical protein
MTFFHEGFIAHLENTIQFEKVRFEMHLFVAVFSIFNLVA